MKVSDDVSVSFTVLRFLFSLGDLSTEQNEQPVEIQVDMCRGSLVKDRLWPFNLRV